MPGATPVPDRRVLWVALGVVRAVVALAAVVLLAGCLGTPTGGTSGTGGTGTGGTPAIGGTPGSGSSGGNGYGGRGGSADGGQGGSGGTGGNGGDGYGGWGGNGYGGDGGSADGDDGAPGADGAPGGFGAPGTDGAPGGSPADTASVAGSGRPTSRFIALPGVTSVTVGAGFVVELTVGGPEHAMIQMDDNLTDRVDATVTGGQLHLGLKPGMNVRNATLSAQLTVRRLDRLTAGGASQVRLVSQLTGQALQLVVGGASQVTGPVGFDHVEAAVSGAGTLTLSGHARDLHLMAAGRGRLLLSDLVVRDLHAVLSGASSATVAVSDTLAATVSGASVLRYRGDPSITRHQTSGTASIVRDAQ